MTEWTAADYAPCPECMHANGCKASKCQQPEACRCVVLCAACSVEIALVVAQGQVTRPTRDDGRGSQFELFS